MKGLSAAPLLHKLLMQGASGRRLWASLLAMGAGLALLLVAVLVWWNFNQILHGRASKDSLGSTFLTISRRVTNDNMGRPEQTVFSQQDVDAIRQAPQVEDLGRVQALKSSAYMSMEIAPGAGFSTVMVLESVPDRFMDKRPADWVWQPGSNVLPVILSSSFLSLYNYAFAPSQGLPQLSEETIKALPFKLAIGEGPSAIAYVAHVAGFSDRITSVLVPESFVQYTNGGDSTAAVSRLILKVSDPSATAFVHYLETHGYFTNSEQLRWSKWRTIVGAVAAVTGVLALLLLGISLLVFMLFIELTVARAQQSIGLLREIGYSPAILNRFISARFLPLLGIAIIAATVIALGAQAAAHFGTSERGLRFALVPGWPMWACLAGVSLLLILQMRRAISRALNSMGSRVV